MAKQPTQKDFEQYLQQKLNTVRELELSARYWKAQHDIKFYTLEEAKLRESYNTLLEEKQKTVDMIDQMAQEQELAAQPDEAQTEETK